MCLTLCVVDPKFSILQTDLAAAYGAQRSVALTHYVWQQEKAAALQALETSSPPSIQISQYETLEYLSIQLVTGELIRERLVTRLRNCLAESSCTIQPGQFFIEIPRGGNTLLIRNPHDENDQRYRRFALLRRDVAMAVKDNQGIVRWASTHFCRLAAKPLSTIIGLGSNRIWPDKYGEIIFGHDLEVVSRQQSMLYFESLPVDRTLRARFSMRFPLCINKDGIEQIAVVGFDPYLAFAAA